jgi:hypothetical protein
MYSIVCVLAHKDNKSVTNKKPKKRVPHVHTKEDPLSS